MCPRNELDLGLKKLTKKLNKKLLAVRPEKVTRRKKRKKMRKAIAKLFALNANAIKAWYRILGTEILSYEEFHFKTIKISEEHELYPVK